MAKISVVIDVLEDEIKAESGIEELSDAIRQELGWLRDSGMIVESWEFISSKYGLV